MAALRERLVIVEDQTAWWAGFMAGVVMATVGTMGVSYVLVHYVLPVLH